HKLIHAIKYHDRPLLARYLGREFASELVADRFFENNPVDIILPIPLHWTRFVKRTYNQARQIALGVSDMTGIPIGDNLQAVRRHVSQTKSGSESRARNVEGVFGVRHAEELDGLHIALLDDVITTGATITAAAGAIINADIKPASLTFISLGATQLR
ncbi:MAG: ComF family protein, partial [Muribaculaceae bacterium]|nr:ComF family protein [Muribaculaceae bacterium]